MTKISDNQTAGTSTTQQTLEPMQNNQNQLTEEQKARIISHFEEMRANPEHMCRNLVTMGLLINDIHLSTDNGISSRDLQQAFAMILIPWHEMHRVE